MLAGESDKSGPIGLAVILVLCAVSYLLFRSMSRHMRKVREHPPGGEPAAPVRPDNAPTSPAQETAQEPAEDQSP